MAKRSNFCISARTMSPDHMLKLSIFCQFVASAMKCPMETNAALAMHCGPIKTTPSLRSIFHSRDEHFKSPVVHLLCLVQAQTVQLKIKAASLKISRNKFLFLICGDTIYTTMFIKRERAQQLIKKDLGKSSSRDRMEINERVMVSFWHGSMGWKECITPGVISKLGTAAIGRSGKTSQAIFHFNIFYKWERERCRPMHIHNTYAGILLNINYEAEWILLCF